MAYWLMKSEPDTFSISDLERLGQAPWDGVRNYQARNFMRNMQPGDQFLFYHSSCQPPGIAGIGRIIGEPGGAHRETLRLAVGGHAISCHDGDVGYAQYEKEEQIDRDKPDAPAHANEALGAEVIVRPVRQCSIDQTADHDAVAQGRPSQIGIAQIVAEAQHHHDEANPHDGELQVAAFWCGRVGIIGH